MRSTRRAVLRAGGLGALFGATSLAGSTGLFGGASGDPRDWQADTEALSETPNRFFGSVDHARLYENREHLPASRREAVASAAYTPLDAGSVASMAGVGGVQFGDYGSGSSVTFGSVTALGSFERGAVEELVRTEGNPETERDYRGLTLFESVDATYEGSALVVTIAGETRQLLDGSAVETLLGSA